MFLAILTISALSLVLGLGLGWAAGMFRVESDPVVDQINRLLPQTQCGQCGYPGCRPYAEAIAANAAGINQCPPGGEAGIRALADLLGRESLSLDPGYGTEKPPVVARIDESVCIGCTLCIQACPVDAILGTSQQMHTVIEAECTGCELCLPPCPVDCIELIEIGPSFERWRWPQPAVAVTSARSASTFGPRPA